jgi:hypothetical protein
MCNNVMAVKRRTNNLDLTDYLLFNNVNITNVNLLYAEKIIF